MTMSIEQPGAPQVNNLPQWINVILGLVSGLVVATGFMIRIIWSLHTRIQRIENQDLNQIIDGRLATDRHDNVYPMITDRVIRPMEKIEDEVKLQGQNIAVLLERDRTGAALERLATALSLGAHSAPTAMPRQSAPQR